MAEFDAMKCINLSKHMLNDLSEMNGEISIHAAVQWKLLECSSHHRSSSPSYLEEQMDIGKVS